ncbi:hypothetical protein AU468_00490 [Alkalispirochaeta sphaeroplastigenens]|uniref:Uncharacterized protein n=1 Tax=Alkalispirochaeta sphaeroplastigenens TaxID=1187066 RepID=A0A2S4K1P5_9SPIO|nr:DUF188 domain-containing protein [Alkalispirochaeta sphaeroplastigenens]POR05686.1 hypothetical protein AU468_00490 [Alkalispirochaeta sphaeroplastigenens]
MERPDRADSPAGGVEIWVDGDSCPVPVREILQRVSRKRGIPVRFCANRDLPLGTGGGDLLKMLVIRDESVDDYLLRETAAAGGIPLVVTRDIPLAEGLVELGVPVMNDRGRLFERDSIRELRSLRDARAEIRAQGLERMSRAATFGKREQKAFADALDRFLAKPPRPRGFPEKGTLRS